MNFTHLLFYHQLMAKILIMDIVDVIKHTIKYNNSNNSRHVSLLHNIAKILTFTTNYININTKSIITKYKQFISQVNVNIIIKCSDLCIKIVPVWYIFNDDLIDQAMIFDIDLIKNFSINLSNDKLQHYLSQACIFGNLNNVKYIHNLLNANIDHYRYNNNEICGLVCENNHLNIVKYLCNYIGLNQQDFESDDNYAFVKICENNYFRVFKFLTKKFPNFAHNCLYKYNTFASPYNYYSILDKYNLTTFINYMIIKHNKFDLRLICLSDNIESFMIIHKNNSNITISPSLIREICMNDCCRIFSYSVSNNILKIKDDLLEKLYFNDSVNIFKYLCENVFNKDKIIISRDTIYQIVAHKSYNIRTYLMKTKLTPNDIKLYYVENSVYYRYMTTGLM